MQTTHTPSATAALSRRNFIHATVAAGAGLSLGFYLPAAAADKLATDGPHGSAIDINAWIRITPDNQVICEVARAEMGQGTSTSLPMMLAEELECRWEDVRMEFASVNEHLARNKVYITFSTGGSRGTRGSQLVMRQAAPQRARCSRRQQPSAGAWQWRMWWPSRVWSPMRLASAG